MHTDSTRTGNNTKVGQESGSGCTHLHRVTLNCSKHVLRHYRSGNAAGAGSNRNTEEMKRGRQSGRSFPPRLLLAFTLVGVAFEGLREAFLSTRREQARFIADKPEPR